MKTTIENALQSAGYSIVLLDDYTFNAPVGASVGALDAALANLDGVRVVRHGQRCAIAFEAQTIISWLQLAMPPAAQLEAAQYLEVTG